MSAVESALQETKAAIEGGNTEQIRQKMEALNNASHKLAEAMYKQASASEQPVREAHPGRKRVLPGLRTTLLMLNLRKPISNRLSDCV